MKAYGGVDVCISELIKPICGTETHGLQITKYKNDYEIERDVRESSRSLF
jgi:hypothetical protein